nr:hypothetical protein [Propionibacterium sp.]
MPDLDAVRRVLGERGPQTGAELHAAVGGEVFGLWKTCRRTDLVATQAIGRRYVRLDRTVEGYARLSPSILREFMTYTVIGLPDQRADLDRAARRLQARTKAISRAKLRVAGRFVAEVFDPLEERGLDPAHFCVLIAGDVVYDMSHDVARRESSTGGRVDGSDLDLVVLADDDAPDEAVETIDAAIRQRKWLYLRNPASREEVDYVVKRFSRLVEQSAFDTFQHMVACKVFDEARFLRGNHALHEAGRRLLAERGIVDRLRELEAQAIERRASREEFLLSVEGDRLPAEAQPQFYTDDEAAEFEHRD